MLLNHNKSETLQTLYIFVTIMKQDIYSLIDWSFLYQYLSDESVIIRYYISEMLFHIFQFNQGDKNGISQHLGLTSTNVFSENDTLLLNQIKNDNERLFFTLKETKSKMFFIDSSNTTESTDSQSPSDVKMNESALPTQKYVTVCDVVLPYKETKKEGQQFFIQSKNFYYSPTVRKNMKALALALCNKQPILLQGEGSSGKTSLLYELASLTGNTDMIQMYIDDQMDSKSLLGTYICTDVPGEFKWQPGALTQAVQEGKWVLIEDINKVPFDVITALIPLVEKGVLSIPGRGIDIQVHPSFRLFGTWSIYSRHRINKDAQFTMEGGNESINSFINNHWYKVFVDSLNVYELQEILKKRFPAFNDSIVF